MLWDRSDYADLGLLNIGRFVLSIEGEHVLADKKITLKEKLGYLPAFTNSGSGNRQLLVQCGVSVTILKSLSFSVNTNYTYESVTALGTKKENIMLVYGLDFSGNK